MELTVAAAEASLKAAEIANPGPWADHARYVALACKNIAVSAPIWRQKPLIDSVFCTTSAVMPVFLRSGI